MILAIRQRLPEAYRERLLLASILRRAAYDIALYKDRTKLQHRKIFAEAHAWMFHDDDSRLPPSDRFTSFRNICMLLDQDPSEVRRKTMDLTKKDVKRFDMVDANGRV